MPWPERKAVCRAGAAAVWGRLDKQVLENCMDVIALALSLVMAGTGDLETLRLLRGSATRLPREALAQLLSVVTH